MSGLDGPRRRKFGDEWKPPAQTPPDSAKTVKVVFTRRRVAVNLRHKKERDADSR